MQRRNVVRGARRDAEKARHRARKIAEWRASCQCCPEYHPVKDMPRREARRRAVIDSRV